MNELEKLFRRIPKKDLFRIESALKKLAKRNFAGLQRQKLQGYESIFRIRVGNYRIIYYDDGKEIWLKAVKKRDESTYSDF